MVGHTGVMQAAIEAVETIDRCLGRLRAAVEKMGGVLVVTADHGNVELMKDPETGEPHTAHTTLQVPLIAVNAGNGNGGDGASLTIGDGRLADVAPTLLALMGLEKPEAMTGHSLAETADAENFA
jgi:2,3-bisphosphoglycerate-independent phosphoglycerate mutase